MTNSAADLSGLRVGFAGTPAFAATALTALHAAGATIPCVLTQPDRPAGRGMKLAASPVKQAALQLGLSVSQPAGLRLDGRHAEDARAAQTLLQQARPDVWVVAAYGLILPDWALALPRLGCLNIHASLLPRWRGAAPIQRAIEAGDRETGVTIMQMDAGLDTGDIVCIEAIPIAPDDNATRVHDRLAELGARLIVQTLRQSLNSQWPRTPQPADGVTYAQKLDKAEAAIDWSGPADLIERRARAFDPVPGLRFDLDGEAIKLWRAALRSDLSGPPGTVLAASGTRWTVACGSGALDLLEVQRPGGRRQPATACLGDRPDKLGRVLPSSAHTD